MKNFFNHTAHETLSTLDKNKKNGKTAERHFAALLTTALDARVSFTSRSEDDAKLDLVTVMSHPWKVNNVEIFFTQVKSGNSYCTLDDKKLLVKKEKLKDLLGRNHNSLICWTNVYQNKSYWFFVKNNSSYFKTYYDESHLLSPLSRFDLTRLVTSVNNKNGGSGLIFTRRNQHSKYESDNYKELRNQAKLAYKILKSETIQNPLFGNVEFTRLGWRHITREKRWYYYEVASLEIIPILSKLLKVSPSRHYIFRTAFSSDNKSNFREIEYLLNYNNVKAYDKEKKELIRVIVYIKLVEVSSYLDDWKNIPQDSNNFKRRVIFKSIYYKESS